MSENHSVKRKWDSYTAGQAMGKALDADNSLDDIPDLIRSEAFVESALGAWIVSGGDLIGFREWVRVLLKDPRPPSPTGAT